MEYVFGIASYNRVDRQPMLEYLNRLGYSRNDIVLSTQTERDYKEYREKWEDKAIIIYREANSISGNKNTILRYVAEHMGNKKVVLCSDKVRGVVVLTQDNKSREINSKVELDWLIGRAYLLAKKTGASIWGLPPCFNVFFLSRTISMNLPMIGCFMGMTDPATQYFDEEQILKEDFEIFMRTIANKGRTLRLNDVTLRATLKTNGGAHELWNSPNDVINKDSCERLLRKFPNLCVPHSTRTNEIRYIGPTKKYKQSIFDL